jgi:CRP-like cAMP-binding protein
MRFKNFYCALHMLGRFSEVELKKIESYVKVIVLPKHAFLLQEGNTCQSIYFVEKGSLRHYYVDESGVDTTLNLFLETDWAFDYQSFTSQKPTASCLQASEDCELLELNVYDLHKLIKESDSFFQLMRILKMIAETPESSPVKLSPKEKY